MLSSWVTHDLVTDEKLYKLHTQTPPGFLIITDPNGSETALTVSRHGATATDTSGRSAQEVAAGAISTSGIALQTQIVREGSLSTRRSSATSGTLLGGGNPSPTPQASSMKGGAKAKMTRGRW